jgi:energy-converting hydrogenase Eha subunit A
MNADFYIVLGAAVIAMSIIVFVILQVSIIYRKRRIRNEIYGGVK